VEFPDASPTGDPNGAAHATPKITVVTVVLNARDFIEETIRSVLNQDYEDLEYVIVDGVSSDGTLDVIDCYRSQIDRLIVEEDRGIYDAMNKAAKVATGDYIIFMNAGDEFAGSSSVSELCRCLLNNETLVYGRWIVKYPWGLERSGSPARPENFWQGMFVQHQSVMVKTRCLLDHPFDLSLGLGADYAFLLRIINSGEVFRECKSLVSRVSAEGASDGNRKDVLMSHWRQARRYYPGLRTDFHYLRRILRERLAATVKKCLPISMIRRITALRVGH
jgi:glycosyltransferase involved in cell wall biosynthesis